MFSFISPESASVAKKIHASYSSCLREAQRVHCTNEAKQLEMFRDCMYFSLALDTAQFGQDHFMSCVGRFGFDDRVDQVILIFEKFPKPQGTKSQDLFLKNSRRNYAIFQ